MTYINKSSEKKKHKQKKNFKRHYNPPTGMTKTRAETRILLIDDDIKFSESVRKLSQMLIKTELRSVNDEVLALSISKDFQPNIVIIDVNLKYISGFKLYEILKETLPNQTKFIFTSNDRSYIRDVKTISKSSSFLPKPFSLRNLKEMAVTSKG